MRLTMVGRLSECYLIAYRTDPARVARLLPHGLELSTHGGHAFWSVVVSKVDRMRPLGAPRLLGQDYAHVAYRLYAKARTPEGTVEGLCFVRSDVDRPLMALAGNRTTDFRFHAGDVTWARRDGALAVDVRTKDGRGDAHLRLDLDAEAPAPPAFLKYMPFGLSCNAAGTKVRLAEVSRDESLWRETPVRVRDARWALFEREDPGAVLVAATSVAPLDYRWRIGRTLPVGA